MYFLLGRQEKEALKTLKEYAEKNPYTMDDILDVLNDQSKCAGNYPEYNCYIPEGFNVVFSIEQQVIGDVRHASVICSDGGLPHIEAVRCILTELGFENPIEKCEVHLEKFSNGQCVNILERISGSPDRR